MASQYKLARQQLRQQDWPSWAQPDAATAAIQETVNQLRAERAQTQQQQQQLAATLKPIMAALDTALTEGQAQQSKLLMGQARRIKQAAGQIDNATNNQFAQLNARLNELMDWQRYATNPKREELLATITELATNPLDPEAQANRVKLLRNEWNALGTVSKSADRKLADAFNKQAQLAFDHCREHFAALSAEREANTEQRRQICQQLESYLATVDVTGDQIKAAEQILRTARDAWRQAFPVERKHAKPLDEKFEALQDQLHQRIKAVWAENSKAKESLVEQAAALQLATDRPLDERINEAKALQRQWQQQGPMPRGAERKLWLKFREACDALFTERDGALQQAKAATQSAVTALDNWVTEFATEVQAAEAAGATEATLRAARSAFRDISAGVPAAVLSRAKRQFEEHCATYSKLLQESQRQALLQRLHDLARWDAACSELGSTAPIPESAADGLLKDLPKAPGSPLDTQALHQLVINAELAADVASPPNDDGLRMQIQVERLQQSMGKGLPPVSEPSSKGANEWIALALTWCAAQPKPADIGPLRERLFHALEKGLQGD